ncbi:hypothetical protein TRVL_08824 [Trypanosoma vivax]|nr:hypothetical protein TRVL_08824 [Trypanosoma vivax]
MAKTFSVSAAFALPGPRAVSASSVFSLFRLPNVKVLLHWPLLSCDVARLSLPFTSPTHLLVPSLLLRVLLVFQAVCVRLPSAFFIFKSVTVCSVPANSQVPCLRPKLMPRCCALFAPSAQLPPSPYAVSHAPHLPLSFYYASIA